MPKRKSYSGMSSKGYVIRKKRKFWRKKKKRIMKRIPLGFPQSHVVRMKYVERVTLNPDNVVYFDQYQFRANDLRDPNFTGIGRQPRSFDQWMTAYNHFTVIGAKIKVTPVRTAGINVTNNMVWGIALTASSNDVSGLISGGTYEDLLETRMIGTSRFRHGGTVYNLNKSSDTCTLKFSAKKFFRKKAIVGDSLYRGDTGSSPSEIAFFTIWGCPPDGSSDSDSQQFLVEIEYIAVLTEPKPLAAS